MLQLLMQMKKAAEEHHSNGMPVLMSVLGRWVDVSGNVHGYLRFTDLHPVPICHTILYGIAKTVWTYFLDLPYDRSISWDQQTRISYSSRSRMKARVSEIRMTSDFGRPAG